jgi:SAM-dependent methyltransferase
MKTAIQTDDPGNHIPEENHVRPQPPTCRACGIGLIHTFANLGLVPISNAFIKPDNAHQGEMFYPLHVMVCHHCWLVQLPDLLRADTHFHKEYMYFSSFSSGWLAHARRYVEMMTARFALDHQSRVMEIASNDGYLLQYFVQANIACLGIEPSSNTAEVARQRNVPSRIVFFNQDTAQKLAAEGWCVDLLLGNNVLAHVPDINGFVGAMPLVLKPEGVITLEFPHLERLIAENQFDTLYHEHYSYLSLTALLPIFRRAGLRVFDVEHLSTHGGSLRLFACHRTASHMTTEAVTHCLAEEQAAGLNRIQAYTAFGAKIDRIKHALLEFLIHAKRKGHQVVAYGAAAKGNTLLNYCGIGTDFIDYVVDKNPLKQGKLLPGSRIPVCAPVTVFDTKPIYLLILAWNIRDEVMEQMAGLRKWGGRFVVPIPQLDILP